MRAVQLKAMLCLIHIHFYQKLNTTIRVYEWPRLAGRRPSLVLLHNYHLIINIFPFIPFLTTVRLWAVRGRRLLPFSRLTQLRAICYVRMERDNERLRCERMSAIRRRFEGLQLQELAPPAHASHTQKKDEVHTAAYLHTLLLAHTLTYTACTPCAHRLHNRHCLTILIAHTTHAA